ncbi:MAG: hypothetical protein R2825_30385 [Saprospiraceae bacterium]
MSNAATTPFSRNIGYAESNAPVTMFHKIKIIAPTFILRQVNARQFVIKEFFGKFLGINMCCISEASSNSAEAFLLQLLLEQAFIFDRNGNDVGDGGDELHLAVHIIVFIKPSIKT